MKRQKRQKLPCCAHSVSGSGLPGGLWEGLTKSQGMHAGHMQRECSQVITPPMGKPGGVSALLWWGQGRKPTSDHSEASMGSLFFSRRRWISAVGVEIGVFHDQVGTCGYPR